MNRITTIVSSEFSVGMLEPSAMSVGMDSQQLSSGLGEAPFNFHTTMPGNVMQQQLSSTYSQAAEMAGSQQISARSRQTSQREPWPKIISLGAQQLLSDQKGTVQQDQSPKFQRSIPTKVGLQKSSSKNKRAAQVEPSPKVSTESFESVRSKMRESLAASLSLVSDELSKSKDEGKIPSSDTVNTSLGDGCTQLSETSSITVITPSIKGEVQPECSSGTSKDADSPKHEQLQDLSSNTKISKCDVQEQHAPLEHNVSFSESDMIKDELLQGNGLCWASYPDAEVHEAEETRDSKRPKLMHDVVKDQIKETPHILAIKIEEELFKLFGGVNKKYKERARSLLFNLRDQNNPELRKRVFSGEIAPERLCSMTVEELASKELSEWRIAKAEELAQMVVLPDSDVDMRRVKKTHKGEFQVEIEHDDNASAEITIGANSLSESRTRNRKKDAQVQPKSSYKDAQFPSKHKGTDTTKLSLGENVGAVDQTPSDNLTTPAHENADFMQDLMVDEFRDVESLPPIPSLDEFMNELDSEPPFENLLVDSTEEAVISDGKDLDSSERKSDTAQHSSEAKLDSADDVLQSKPISASDSSELKPDNASPSLATKLDWRAPDSTGPLDVTYDNSSKADTKQARSISDMKHDSVNFMPSTHSSNIVKGAHIWDGLVQLNISSLVTVLGFFKSGEQASTKDWPGFLEIKGRVRLDAFEKFLQELSLSRSRAIMVLQFCWKEGSAESGRIKLCETIDSYIADERVGFAEPGPGVELYFCPPHQKTCEILIKNLSKEHEEVLKSANDGLLGVVVWRRPRVTSTISSRLTSHPKRTPKNHFPSSNQLNSNANRTSNSSVFPPAEELNDDAPPGFGPPAAREEDDLPEFDFVQSRSHISASNVNSKTSGHGIAHPYVHPPARPVEQMRQLIHKYGQNETKINLGMNIEPWNDDDDDIPEWQPDQKNQFQLQPSPPPLPPATPYVYGYQQQAVQPHLISQQYIVPPRQPMYPSSSVLPYQQRMPSQAPHSGWQSGHWRGPPQGQVHQGFLADQTPRVGYPQAQNRMMGWRGAIP